jgi:AcrR family transcriptional regulator
MPAPYHRTVNERTSVPEHRPGPPPRAGGDLKRPFFEHALVLLATVGYGGFKQAALCKSLGVTTGAFYHSFGGWKDFCTEFLDFWYQERTVRIAETAQAHSDPVERLGMLVEAVGNLPHRAEAAIRAWAAVDPTAARVQRTVDLQRYDVAEEAFEHVVSDPQLARRYALAGVAMLTGFEQSVLHDEDAADLEWSLRLLLDAARRDAPSTPQP